MAPPPANTLASAVSAGDERAFAKLTDRYRSELQAHCCRLMGSLEDSEDLVQETFLRAWQSRASFRGGSYRAWLYRIASNACFDALKRRRRRPAIADGPEAGELVKRISGTEAEPLPTLVNRETVELAFSAAVRHLPQRQRAVLVLRAVLGLVVQGRRTPARVDRGVGQQRSPAGTSRVEREPPRAAARMGLGAGPER